MSAEPLLCTDLLLVHVWEAPLVMLLSALPEGFLQQTGTGLGAAGHPLHPTSPGSALPLRQRVCS